MLTNVTPLPCLLDGGAYHMAALSGMIASEPQEEATAETRPRKNVLHSTSWTGVKVIALSIAIALSCPQFLLAQSRSERAETPDTTVLHRLTPRAPRSNTAVLELPQTHARKGFVIGVLVGVGLAYAVSNEGGRYRTPDTYLLFSMAVLGGLLGLFIGAASGR